MKRLFPIVILALFSGIAGFLLYRGLDDDPAQAAGGQAGAAAMAPTFTLPDVSGQVRSSTEWDGKVRVVNFWATWCPPCLREIPLLVDIQREYAELGVQMIGIAVDETEAVQEFAGRIPFNFPVLVGQQEAVELANGYLPDFVGLPFTAFIDTSGRIVHVHTGEIHRDQIEAILSGLL